MNANHVANHKGRRLLKRVGFFPAFVLALYGIGGIVSPDKTVVALRTSANVLRTMSLPLVLVFAVMLLLNRFVRPARITGLLGRSAGWKAILMATGAGILSVGPVFAWYPLMRKLKQEGADQAPIAVFLYNRAVKLPILPVMVKYFGWAYVGILTLLTVLGSLVLGCAMRLVFRNR